MVFWLAVILLLVEMLCFLPIVMPGRLVNLFPVELLLHNADFMARYMSTVASDDTRYAHFAMELLFLCEHSWEFINDSNNSTSFSPDEIDDILSAVLR